MTQLPPQVPTIVLKVKCGEDYRKFKYPTNGGSFVDLKSKVQHLYQLGSGDPMTMKYKDGDGDLITIADDDDLRLAMELEKSLVMEVAGFQPQIVSDRRTGTPSVMGKDENKMDEQVSKLSISSSGRTQGINRWPSLSQPHQHPQQFSSMPYASQQVQPPQQSFSSMPYPQPVQPSQPPSYGQAPQQTPQQPPPYMGHY